MSFRIIPANIIQRMQNMWNEENGQTLNESQANTSNTDSSVPHAGKRDDDGTYNPSPIDVAVVRIMLAKATKLPIDVVDGIFELAEYWVRTTTATDYSSSPLTVGSSEGEDRFLIRSLPVGFTSEHGGNLDLTGERAPAKPLQNEIPAKTLARMADYPLPKLQGPVRKVVFKFTSHDQGWSGESGGLYENSWTWFEAGLERLESSDVGTPQEPAPTALPHAALRSIYPPIVKDEPEPVSDDNEKQDGTKNANETENAEKAEGEPEEPVFKYDFPLMHDPKWTVSRNKRAHRDWQDHAITWSCKDNVKPDSDAGKALEDNGRGRETGDGTFVRSLRLGDVVTLWAKARFPGWVNSVKSASIDVYWAAT